MARIDWLTIETEYRGTTTSINKMALNHGISDGAIRKQAKKNGWIRDSGELRRSLVKDKLDGITRDSTGYAVRTLIEQSAEQDVIDMSDGLAVARGSIKKLLVMIEICEEAKEVKIILEANKIAIDTIRRIRGLDAEVEVSTDSWEMHLRSIEDAQND